MPAPGGDSEGVVITGTRYRNENIDRTSEVQAFTSENPGAVRVINHQPRSISRPPSASSLSFSPRHRQVSYQPICPVNDVALRIVPGIRRRSILPREILSGNFHQRLPRRQIIRDFRSWIP